jgi:hypothetical protein
LGKSALKGTDATGTAGGFLARASAATSSSTLAKTATGVTQAAAGKTTKPIEEVKDGESSGYSDFDEVEIA